MKHPGTHQSRHAAAAAALLVLAACDHDRERPGGMAGAAGGASAETGSGENHGSTDSGFTYPLCQAGDEPAGLFPEDTGAPRSVGVDDIAVAHEEQCQPFSGCKTLDLYRNAQTNDLVWADIRHDAATLAKFSDLTGIPLLIEPKCQLASTCFPGVPETHHRLVVRGDVLVRLEAGTHAVVSVHGQSYTVWFGAAVTVPAEAAAACVDAGGFWRGSLTVTVTR